MELGRCELFINNVTKLRTRLADNCNVYTRGDPADLGIAHGGAAKIVRCAYASRIERQKRRCAVGVCIGSELDMAVGPSCTVETGTSFRQAAAHLIERRLGHSTHGLVPYGHQHRPHEHLQCADDDEAPADVVHVNRELDSIHWKGASAGQQARRQRHLTCQRQPTYYVFTRETERDDRGAIHGERATSRRHPEISRVRCTEDHR
ncbi:hypothetical protein HPB52_006636 [Rhipicephalus sanguineus]|uniref:Uncharacterized protein n=1 Tax=Rhipicephalus sanguineus TaxID=34632 RepID=A0A9D4T727_RHISA|nr:hypothetical protein HPB52_006636 [Rhipicephalus sanguineus]